MTDRPNRSPASAETQRLAPGKAAAAPDTEETAPHGWAPRLSKVLFIIFCFELGLFLLIYPWTESWIQNYFSWLAVDRFHSGWHDFWRNTYFRGAVSGLGAANVWIAIAEVARLFPRRRDR